MGWKLTTGKKELKNVKTKPDGIKRRFLGFCVDKSLNPAILITLQLLTNRTLLLSLPLGLEKGELRNEIIIVVLRDAKRTTYLLHYNF